MRRPVNVTTQFRSVSNPSAWSVDIFCSSKVNCGGSEGIGWSCVRSISTLLEVDSMFACFRNVCTIVALENGCSGS